MFLPLPPWKTNLFYTNNATYQLNILPCGFLPGQIACKHFQVSAHRTRDTRIVTDPNKPLQGQNCVAAFGIRVSILFYPPLGLTAHRPKGRAPVVLPRSKSRCCRPDGPAPHRGSFKSRPPCQGVPHCVWGGVCGVRS